METNVSVKNPKTGETTQKTFICVSALTILAQRLQTNQKDINRRTVILLWGTTLTYWRGRGQMRLHGWDGQ